MALEGVNEGSDPACPLMGGVSETLQFRDVLRQTLVCPLQLPRDFPDDPDELPHFPTVDRQELRVTVYTL